MDIKELRNNQLRQQFLEERKTEQGWYLWLAQPEVERRFERVDIQGTAFICELKKIELTYPKVHNVWRGDIFYIIPIDVLEEGTGRKRPFSAYIASKTMCIEELKKLGRKASGK